MIVNMMNYMQCYIKRGRC